MKCDFTRPFLLLLALATVWAQREPDAVFAQPTGTYQYFNVLSSWTSANDMCKQRGGYLASIRSLDQSKFVEAKLMAMAKSISPGPVFLQRAGCDFIRNVWVGYHDPTGTSRSKNTTTRYFMWTDGARDPYPGAVCDTDEAEYCMGMAFCPQDEEACLTRNPCDWKQPYLCWVPKAAGV